MNEAAWERIAEEEENLQPTPSVGEPIVWLLRGNKEHKAAGLVTGIEGSGRIKAVVFAHGNHLKYVAGCYHITSDIHKKANNATTLNGGAWDYPNGKAPKAAYSQHEDELKNRREQLFKSEEDAKKNEELFALKKAEREAAIKKRLPPIMQSV